MDKTHLISHDISQALCIRLLRCKHSQLYKYVLQANSLFLGRVSKGAGECWGIPQEC